MRGRALRLMAIRQAGLEPLALSAADRERMVYGRAVVSEEKKFDLSDTVARFGDILKKGGRSSRSGPARSLSIWRSVDGSSQRGRVCARSDPPLVWRGGWGWSVRRWGRENNGQMDVGGLSGFPSARRWVAASALSADLGAEWA